MWGGFDSGRSFLATRLNQLQSVVSARGAPSLRSGSTGLEVAKLVEPTCEWQRAGRVETGVTLSGDLGWVCCSGAEDFDSGRCPWPGASPNGLLPEFSDARKPVNRTPPRVCGHEIDA